MRLRGGVRVDARRQRVDRRARVIACCTTSSASRPRSESRHGLAAPAPPGRCATSRELASDFWYHALWTAKKLRRGEVYTAISCLDGYMKARLVTLLEWHARAVDPTVDTWHGGRFLERWADPGALAALERAYAHYDLRDVARALWETIDLWQSLEEETARRLGLVVELDHADLQAACRGGRSRSEARGYAVTVARALIVLIALALVAGCGGDEETTQVRVYWLRDGQVWPAARAVEGPLVESAALTELFLGPSPEEEEELDATTAIPGGDPTLTIEGGVARIQPQGEYSTRSARPDRLHAHTVSGHRVRRDRRRELHARRLRGADAVRPRRVAAPLRRGNEPAAGDGNGQHLRGELQLRAPRQRRERRRRELRDGDLGYGDAGDVRLHDRRLRRNRRTSRLRALGGGRLADSRGRDPPSDVAVADPAA